LPQRVPREDLRRRPSVLRALVGLVALLPAVSAAATPAEARVERGAYLFKAAGCGVCHTDSDHGGPTLAGGRALKTDYGVFYTPNISPDPKFGIGRWSDADFLKALRKGVSPAGTDYYPVFPYPAFTQLSDDDILDLKAYLFSQTPVPQPNRPHDVGFPYS